MTDISERSDRRDRSQLDLSMDRFIASKYGIKVEEGDDITQIITPDFKEGSVLAIEVSTVNGEQLRIDKERQATIIPLFGTEKDRISLRDFVYREISYRHKPETEWTPDFRRGVDAQIAYSSNPVQAQFRKEFAFFVGKRDWEARHPILGRLGLARPCMKLVELLT